MWLLHPGPCTSPPSQTLITYQSDCSWDSGSRCQGQCVAGYEQDGDSISASCYRGGWRYVGKCVEGVLLSGRCWLLFVGYVFFLSSFRRRESFAATSMLSSHPPISTSVLFSHPGGGEEMHFRIFARFIVHFFVHFSILRNCAIFFSFFFF